jgi:CBS domain-containing protein
MNSVRELLQEKVSTVITIRPDTDVGAAARLLFQHNIGGLPVVSKGRVLGFVSERDIVRAVDENRESIRQLKAEQIMKRPPPVCSANDSLLDVMGRMTRHRLRHLIVLDDDAIAGVISVGDLVKHRLEQLETETVVLRDYVAARRATS